jgi:predicted alpha/beta superfamily hydrolase
MRTLLGILVSAVALSIAAVGVGLMRNSTVGTADNALRPQNVELRLHDLSSNIFGNTRKLRVLLPPDYDAAANRTRRYPVLYLNDGQNLFDSTTATLNPMEWRVDETMQQLLSNGRIPPMIIVGIDNAGRRDRFKEYFPYVDQYLEPPEPNPQGNRYPAFLLDEVIPFIEASYRVDRNPKSRGLGGSSAGALAALYTIATRPGTFGRLLMESPSLYVDDYHILRDVAGVSVWPDRIFLGVGTNEDGRPSCDPNATGITELVADVRRLQRTLHGAGMDTSRIKLVVTPCGLHNEAAWAARLPAALAFLFGESR